MNWTLRAFFGRHPDRWLIELTLGRRQPLSSHRHGGRDWGAFMKTIGILTAAIALSIPAGALASVAEATVPEVSQEQSPAAAPITEPATENAVLRAGTPVVFRLMEEITTKKKAARVGQRFQLEVSAPIEVNGVEVVPNGTPAWGEITEVRNKGMWGKSGKLNARLLYLRVNGRQVRLTGTFDDKGVTGTAGVVGSIALVPIAGFFMTGTSAVLPKGGTVNGFIDEDVVLAFKQEAPKPLEVPAVSRPLEVSVSSPVSPAIEQETPKAPSGTETVAPE